MTIRFKIQFNVMKLNFISSAQWYEILSEIAGFFFKFGPRGRSRDPLPPEWTSEDLLLTPLPSLLVHVVVEWAAPKAHTIECERRTSMFPLLVGIRNPIRFQKKLDAIYA